ncbi:MAG: thermonuclease family protein [Alphaproteobacteria bacterium]|nr:thermonuclease family protein [Alphaproteobacteria bacterium]
MKKLSIFFAVVCFGLNAVAVPARVDYVIDGDTFAAVVNLEPDVEISVRVRLRNVDTPEISGECEYERNMAQAAKLRLGQIIPVGTVVQLENIKDDKYLGRIDANVITPNGHDISELLISEGLGRKYSGGRRKPWCENISK